MKRENRKLGIRTVSGILAAMLLLTGCGTGTSGTAETGTEAETTGPEIQYTVPPDGEPGTVSCLGSYTRPFDGSTVAAAVGEENLTNGQLNALYHLMVNEYEPEEGGPAPDLSLPLDSQLVEGKNITWQQFFLDRALNSWYTFQALQLKSLEPSQRTEEDFEPVDRLHNEYMANAVIDDVLYQLDNTFKPNTVHQAYLDALPETLQAAAAELGYGDVNEMVRQELGEQGTLEDLQQVAWLANIAYMYYTEQTYDRVPDPETVAGALSPSGRQVVDVRHILVIPEGAQVDGERKVQATEEQWAQCDAQAQDIITTWRKNWEHSEYTFAALAHDLSQDPATALNGGLFTNIRKGQLTEALDSWCFQAGRQPGDIEVVRSEYGCHVMYFCAARDENYAETSAELLQNAMDAFVQEAREAYPMTVQYDKITLEPVNGQGKLRLSDHLLYPDVGHQRIPEVPVYIQQDYAKVGYAKVGTVATNGCGITTLAMLSTYLADDYLTPRDLALRYRDRYSYVGTDGNIFNNVGPEMGYYLIEKNFDLDRTVEALKQGYTCVSLQYKGYFTRGGHYLCLADILPDDMVIIRDSNVYNYKRLPEHAQDAFPAQKLKASGQGFWVFDYKVVTLPNCSRCGNVPDPHEPDMTKAPPLLREDFLCPKCRAALARRNGFLASAGLN